MKVRKSVVVEFCYLKKIKAMCSTVNVLYIVSYSCFPSETLSKFANTELFQWSHTVEIVNTFYWLDICQTQSKHIVWIIIIIMFYDKM